MKTKPDAYFDLESYFDSVEESFVAALQQLVSIRSVKEDALPDKPFGQGVADALDNILKQAHELGMITRNHEGYVGTIDLNELEPELGILVHVDVVGEGDNWTKPPYAGVVEDDKLYARGATDDKGPAIASLFAMAAVKELGIPLHSGVRLIVGTDEESGCSDTKYYFSKEQPPKYVFSPDGVFPVINTEKGGLRTSFEGVFEEDVRLPRVLSVSGGYRVNVVPPSAEAVVEGLELNEVRRYAEEAAGATGAVFTCKDAGSGRVAISVQGAGGHASTPWQGINAVTSLLTLLAALPMADSEAHRALLGVNRTFPHGDHYGEAAGIRMEDEVSGPLTFNFSIFEFAPQRIYGFFDSRIPICATESNTMDVLEQKLSAFGVKLKRAGFSKPHHTPADSEFVQTLLRCYEQYTGLEGTCHYSGGGTYVHGIEGGVAFGCTMPGVDPRPHGADEFVILKDLITSAKIFAQVIIDICGQKVDKTTD
ncbi:Sapep family Mn(2+)-dependent dipeptidase [Paenibacillus senegalensis]|uniref:Sapep family Mn(2+)-dependent dipeptidase n=1 Tax=Paenibacillus senegalensis TaxID=1465766 RepID=UPI000288368D|nr:Sapep family Mn(2+)-dependent dipeptidase [Paenibacillus senegalensis]